LQSSLASIIRPAPNGYKPHISGRVLYDGPDGHNKCYDVAEDEVDTLAIVSGRRQLVGASDAQMISQHRVRDSSSRYLEAIEPGKGWELILEKPGLCDGDYYSICGRASNDDCPALAHHDSRGAIVGNEFSGWIIMDIPEIQHGLLMLRFLSYLTPEDSPRTADWSSVNNERRVRRLGSARSNQTVAGLAPPPSIFDPYDPENPMDSKERHLKALNDFPDEFKFEYSVNGVVTTLNKQEFIDKRTEPQRVFELLTLLDDASFTGKNVEVAVRLRDCGHDCMLGLTHIYWA
jgi:hypothetical protein